MDTQPATRIYAQVGGNLCFDFINTVGERKVSDQSGRRDYFESYGDLVEWARQMGVLTEGQARGLLNYATQQPEQVEEVLGRARELRETIYQLFLAVVESKDADEARLEKLNIELLVALRHRALAYIDGDYAWAWRGDEAAPDRMLWSVALSAAELLTKDNERLARVRECAGDTCGWLFVDMSRNHSRQWCDMRDCGNRVKAQRHYRRKKASAALEEVGS